MQSSQQFIIRMEWEQWYGLACTNLAHHCLLRYRLSISIRQAYVIWSTRADMLTGRERHARVAIEWQLSFNDGLWLYERALLYIIDACLSCLGIIHIEIINRVVLLACFRQEHLYYWIAICSALKSLWKVHLYFHTQLLDEYM